MARLEPHVLGKRSSNLEPEGDDDLERIQMDQGEHMPASPAAKEDHRRAWGVAIFAFVLSAAFHSAMSLSVKVASRHFPTSQILWARYTVQFMSTSIILLWRREGKCTACSMTRQLKALLLLRGIFGMLSQGCHMLSVRLLPLADAVSLHTVYPVLTALLAPWVLGEPLSVTSICAALVATVGCAFIARGRLPQNVGGVQGSQAKLGVGIALVGALCASITYLLIRKLMRRASASAPLAAEVVVWAYALTALCVLLVALPFTATSFVLWEVPSLSWGALLAVGATSVVEQLLVTLGFRGLPATAGTLLLTLEAGFAFLFGAVVLHEALHTETLLGASCVAAAVTLTALRQGGRAAEGSAGIKQDSTFQFGASSHQVKLKRIEKTGFKAVGSSDADSRDHLKNACQDDGKE